MSRTKGTLGLSSNIEPSMNAPLDGREVTGTLADLTTASTFPYFYEGMKVYVKSEHKTYQLVGSDPTVAANWKVEGSDITIDSTPTAESTNAVSSGGVYAELEEKADLVNGKIPASQLPSYVDDVIEGYYKEADGKFYEESTYETEIPGEAGKSFVDKGANKSYRWTGSAFVRVDEGVSLGETSTTAYRGDRGKTAYEDSQANKQHIGDLTQLQTVEKTNLVGAINEAAESGGDGHTIKNTSGTSLTQRSNLQFDGDFEVDDDSENNATVVTPHELTNAEIEEIITEIPGPPVNILRLGNKFDRGDMYSTEERMIGQWIDGKPLYQKTIDCGALPNTTIKNVAHGISNIGYIIWSKFSAMTSAKTSIPLPYVNNSAIANQVQVHADSTNVVISTKGDFSEYAGYATFQYTKSTDSAIAIGEDTDYSTTEKIVGSWIDGKPLYQKTVEFGALPNNTTKTLQHNIANISRIISFDGYAYSPSTGWMYPLLRAGYGTYDVTGNVNDTNIQLGTQYDMSDFTETYVTLKYTKTTD